MCKAPRITICGVTEWLSWQGFLTSFVYKWRPEKVKHTRLPCKSPALRVQAGSLDSQTSVYATRVLSPKLVNVMGMSRR